MNIHRSVITLNVIGLVLFMISQVAVASSSELTVSNRDPLTQAILADDLVSFESMHKQGVNVTKEHQDLLVARLQSLQAAGNDNQRKIDSYTLILNDPQQGHRAYNDAKCQWRKNKDKDTWLSKQTDWSEHQKRQWARNHPYGFVDRRFEHNPSISVDQFIQQYMADAAVRRNACNSYKQWFEHESQALLTMYAYIKNASQAAKSTSSPLLICQNSDVRSPSPVEQSNTSSVIVSCQDDNEQLYRSQLSESFSGMWPGERNDISRELSFDQKMEDVREDVDVVCHDLEHLEYLNALVDKKYLYVE